MYVRDKIARRKMKRKTTNLLQHQPSLDDIERSRQGSGTPTGK